MACGGYGFLLLTFQYLVGLGLINLVISMNSVSFVYIENIQRRSPAVRDPRGDKSPRNLCAVVRTHSEIVVFNYS